MKTFMSDWQGRCEARPAAVLGGGPSLPDDMAKLPSGCVLIAVNHHALRLCRPDFVVFNDDPGDDLLRALEEMDPGILRVSSHRSSDIVFDVEVWQGFYSSNTAAWFGLWLGCDPVILCGMDCYQGKQMYFYERVWDGKDAPSYGYPLEHHIRPWIEEGLNLLRGVGRVKAMSGPLVGVFGRYDPATMRGTSSQTADRRPEGIYG